MKRRNWLFLVLCLLTGSALAGEPQDEKKVRALVEAAVKAAGGATKLPKILHWRETYYLTPDPADKGTPREAYLNLPTQWFQDGKDIAAGNPDRTEKTYLVWVWTLGPLLDKDSKLALLPTVIFNNKPIRGLRISRAGQNDIDIYFDARTNKLARIDWRAFQIDFDDWRETQGFKYPVKAFVRFKDGKLHLRNEFHVLEVLKALPNGLR